MGVETRKGRLYEYHRKRVNGRLRAAYVGPLDHDEAEFLCGRARSERDRRKSDRSEVHRLDQQAKTVLDASTDFDSLADRLFRSVMFLTGYRLHKRAEWRLARRGVPMVSFNQLFSGAVRSPLVTPYVLDPAKQEVLDRAAQGDVAALPAVRELLKNGQFLDSIGAVGGMAVAALIAQAAGDNLAVGEAMIVKYREYVEKLLADGGPNPTFAERWAATRAAHNWLTVHILECMAAKATASSAAALAVDRRVTLAERRLHASLKSLAVLRRLRRPAPMKQVNVSHGPMFVENRAVG